MATQRIAPGLLCRFGLHRWTCAEASARPGTFVYRCRDCGRCSVVHRRKPKRFVAAPRLLWLCVDLVAWIFIVGGLTYFFIQLD